MNDKNRVRILGHVMPALVVFVIVVGMFFNFSSKMKEEAEETVQRELQYIAETYATKVNTEFQYVKVAGETIAQVIKGLNVKNSETLTCSMVAVTEKTGAYEAVFYRKGFQCVDKDGEIFDLSGAAYFSLVEQTTASTKCFYIEDDGMNGQEALLVIVPLPDMEASILLFYEMQKIEQMLNIETEYDNTLVLVLDEKGTILADNGIASNFIRDNQLWENVDSAYASQLIRIKADIRHGKTNAYRLEADKEARTLIYVPLNINDWVTIIAVDQEYVDARMNRAWENTSMLLYQLAAVFVLFVAAMVLFYYVGKKRSAESRDALEKKADTDLLTGLNNKLATERKIKDYMKESPDTLAMMFVLDIDNFKKINDTMGHAFGDKVLSSLGRSISANFRVSDIIGRTGGDEFTIFLKALKDDEATLREAGKLVNFFKDFQVGEYVKYSATASIGAAVFPADGEDFESLYKAADQALYKAKKRGKNQLAFYDDRDRQN